MNYYTVSLLVGTSLLGVVVWLSSGSSTNSPSQRAAANISSKGNTSGSPDDRGSIDLNSKPESNESVQAKKQGSKLKYVHEDPRFLTNLNSPYGFSVEPFTRSLIWTSSGDETFKVANPDGTNIRVIQTNFEEPYHIKVLNSFGYTLLFYTDGKLKKKMVDTQLGTESEQLLLELGEQKIHGLGFEEAHNTIFIGDQFGQPTLVMRLPDDGNAISIKKITPLTPLLMER